jgi:hypothetical protein
MNMHRNIYELLKLNPHAGLGQRLAQAEINFDARDPNLLIIRHKDVVETLALVQALTKQAEKLNITELRFKQARI